MTQAASVAVVIATRDRPEGAARAASSVLRSYLPGLEVCIVDQSEGDATRQALRHVAADPRAVIVASAGAGLGAARNVGLRRTAAPIVLFTDDDCEVDAYWPEALAAAFDRDPRIGVVFGSVHAAEYDRAQGLVQAYHVPEFRLAKTVSEKARIEGIGACMGVRRSVWEAIRGFDEQFGAGAPLRAAEETDFMIRALVWGHWVAETPGAAVVHHGFRPWAEAGSLIEGYMYGLGAAYAKMARLGRLRAVRPLAALALRWLGGNPAVDLNHRPPRLARLRGFLRGVRAGLRPGLDPGGRFIPPLPVEDRRRARVT